MFPCLRRVFLLSFHLFAFQPTFTAAYSWVLNTPPTQCLDLSINITGFDGVPPYRVLVVPTGPTPLPHSTEVRSVIDHPFDGNSTTTNFAINYPGDSQFVAVVSDARGFGTGGASVATRILDSGDSSCFSVSKPYSVPFDYNVGSGSQFTQCGASRIWWDESTVQGTPNFVGIIPGGQSFTIPESNITNVPRQGTGFSWTASIRSGVTLIIVAGDNRGLGAGGWATFTVNINDDSSCLTGISPSSTPGTPAGAYPTSTAASSNNPNSGSNSGQGNNKTALIGGIVGGVVGGLLIVLAAGTIIYCLRRNTRAGQVPRRDYVLSQYNPEPFLAMMPTTENTNRGSKHSSTPLLSSTQSGNMSSGSGSGGYYRPGTSGSGSGPYYRSSEFGSRNDPPSEIPGSSQREPWNVDVIQHEDSGLTLLPPAEERIVELPPRYDNIRTRDRPSLEILLQSHGVQDLL